MFKETKCPPCYTGLSIRIKGEICEAIFFCQICVNSHAMILTLEKLW